MTARRRPGARAAAFTAVALLAGAPLWGQERAPPDSLRPRPPRADSTAAPDTVAAQDTTVAPADTVPAPTRVLPLVTPEIPSGPLAPGARLTFTRDSIAWGSGYTLADLLGTVPGVYIARGGFLGQPEPVTYAGRGPTAIEIYWDGVRMIPVGPDSLAVDPGRISLFPLRRVEVEVLPAALRVYLVSERHEETSTRSVVRIVSGDFETGAYAGLFQRRWQNGIGINVGADFLGTEGARDPPRDANWFDLWAKLEWTPTPTTGAAVQVRRHSYERDPFGSDAALLVPGRQGRRTDVALRFFAATRPDHYGVWTEAGLTSTAWAPDSASPDTTVSSRTFRRAFAGLGVRGRRASTEIRARIGDYFTTAEAEARLGWVPVGGIVLSADGAVRRHRDNRTSRLGRASLGLYGGPFSMVGDVAVQRLVPAPALPDDTARTATDYGIRAALTTHLLSGYVGFVRRDAFDPVPFTAYPGTVVRPAVEARYVTAAATLRLGAWSLDGWYSNPTAAPAPDFQPPTHGRAAITFRSQFIRTFRSSVFDFKVQIAMESWSGGTAGLDAQGAEVPLIGATFYEGFLQLQLVGFQIFYSLKNAYNSREQFVPGLEYPRNIQTFGVKWVFTN